MGFMEETMLPWHVYPIPLATPLSTHKTARGIF